MNTWVVWFKEIINEITEHLYKRDLIEYHNYRVR